MRLGSQPADLVMGTKAREIYQSDTVTERHRHRYEVNNNLLPQLEEAGLVVSCTSTEKKLVEMVELADHPWYVACQFHPEFNSTPRDGHPLFSAFINAAKNIAQKNRNSLRNHYEIIRLASWVGPTFFLNLWTLRD